MMSLIFRIQEIFNTQQPACLRVECTHPAGELSLHFAGESSLNIVFIMGGSRDLWPSFLRATDALFAALASTSPVRSPVPTTASSEPSSRVWRWLCVAWVAGDGHTSNTASRSSAPPASSPLGQHFLLFKISRN